MYDDNGYNVKTMPCGVIAPETSGWICRSKDTAQLITLLWSGLPYWWR